MNQDKSGKFIAKLRKEKNMTQEQLAEKMGVSINAISKWERGLNFPDVSLYKKLCNELGINIEELINGEKDISEEAKEKAIISTVKEKIKKNSKNVLILLLS
ncbi:MAG: helix-turn-helix transcriptional regulator [Firmicutes bacterium]|nr:helix-turn-helix transcriptional regulator [Bacillota bacterium]